MRHALLVIAIAGCAFEGRSGVANPDGDTGNTDGDVDNPIDQSTCADFTVPSGQVDPCMIPPASGWTVSTAGTYDTNNGSFTGGAAPIGVEMNGLRIVSVESFEITSDGSLRVVGDVPLVVVSWSTIVIAGTIDCSSRRHTTTAQIAGAGANGPSCMAAANGGGNSDSGGGGGGGFGAGGGKGGKANGGAGGGAITAPTTIVGGCAGGHGGTDANAGQGGAGGGVVRLIARVSIDVASTGRMNAGGAGGGGGIGDSGGGGGGSGGAFGFEAPVVRLASNAVIAANGGGGGTGCDGGSGGPNGENARLSTGRALGGAMTGCSAAASGGLGGSFENPAGDPGMDASSGASGAGGGGGVGFILVWGTLENNATTSPAITPM